MAAYQPKTGKRCFCKRGIQRDNCPSCEGTGWQIDFKAIHQSKSVWDEGASGQDRESYSDDQDRDNYT